ncbi:MAG: MBL fold metallo-hydrolase [Verrucomicrobia bacterium]|nr:MBL fold metallo-hydrolase [Verrucomicrobiota bacterium]
MKTLLPLFLLILALSGETFAATFARPDARANPDLFVWTDTCNVYVLRNGDAALLIDLGDGGVLDHLSEIGVKQVEWVLFTHHHREQCQGAPRLRGTGAKVGAPAAERALFERPADFRKMKVRLGDAFTIHGASYVRPPIQPIAVDRAFERMDTFTWRGHEFWCVDTRGNSPGAMSYLLRAGDRWLAFTGDLMLEGARLHTWFDSEWDYGFAAGVWALANSAAQVAGYNPSWLLPSHGRPVSQPGPQLAEFQEKLFKFERLYVRGYPVNSFASAVQDRTSRPTKVPHVWQVLPHVYKFRGPGYFPNFYLIIADSGHGLAVDCGLLNTNQLDTAIAGMKEHLGLKQIDAIIPTHMHGDHFLQAPHLRAKWGAQIWALDRMGPVCERPEWFDYSAPIQAYGIGVDSVRFDRLFADGERLRWEGYDLTVDWMPGQTEFALCVQGVIDGKKVAFTGDNIFGDPRDPEQNGHEAMVAHNSAVLEEGYIYGAEYLQRLKPDILLGGHSYVMDEPAAFIERYRRWAYAMRDAFRSLSSEDDYRYWFDPFWVRAEPYRSTLQMREALELSLHVRNFGAREQTQRIEIHAPPGLIVEPARLDARLGASKREKFRLKVTATSEAKPGVQLIAFDITRDGRRYGELFDAIVEIRPAAP